MNQEAIEDFKVFFDLYYIHAMRCVLDVGKASQRCPRRACRLAAACRTRRGPHGIACGGFAIDEDTAITALIATRFAWTLLGGDYDAPTAAPSDPEDACAPHPERRGRQERRRRKGSLLPACGGPKDGRDTRLAPVPASG